MNKMTYDSAKRLQKILNKRLGRTLTGDELEQAYESLMGFAEALLELSDNEPEDPSHPLKKINNRLHLPIADQKESILKYV
jgi:benzoyl-CoA reductase/2-hydroxyglutaryl-CoA dehydratase subunit BcrC/BadD/HgdB